MANKEQVKRLLTGVAGWNEWRRDRLDEVCDLEGAHLEGASLEGAYLQQAKLHGAHLDGSRTADHLDAGERMRAPFDRHLGRAGPFGVRPLHGQQEVRRDGAEPGVLTLDVHQALARPELGDPHDPFHLRDPVSRLRL